MKMQVVKKDNKYYGELPDTGWISCNMKNGFSGLKARVVGKILYIAGIVNGSLTANTFTTVATLPREITNVWTAPTNVDAEFTTYCRGQNNSITSVTVSLNTFEIILNPSASGTWARPSIAIPGD